MLLVLLGTFTGLMLLGMPVAFALGLGALLYIALTAHQQFPLPLEMLPQTMVSGIDGFALLAIPFFILVGDLMTRAALTGRLVQFATALVGHIRGGLAQAVVFANLLMAGMSGSAIADTTATGSVLIPALKRAGYRPEFAAALTAAASTIGPIFPPSAPMAIIGALLGISVGRLFLGGVVPGLLMTMALMAFAYVLAVRRSYPRNDRFSIRVVVGAVPRVAPSLGLPVILIGAILAGVATPTEAATLGIWYALVLGVLYRSLRLGDVYRALVDVGVLTAAILFIVATSNTLGVLAGIEQFGPKLLRLLASVGDSPLAVLMLVNGLLLVLGLALEPLPLTVVMLPLLFPVVTKLGIDPVHFGVVMTLNLMLAMLTPPVALLSFIAAGIAGASPGRVMRETMPFFWVLVLVLIAITAFPGLVLWLPDTLMGPR